ncbi:MAG TPA: recombinase family protein [Terriglobales bacterium]
MSKNVIELIRVSTEGQAAADRASIPAQRTVNRRTCAQYGLQIVKSIEIADVSGVSVLLAPEIQDLLRLMQSPDIEGVVTREFSRLMRPENYSDYALLQAFADTDTLLFLPEGPIDFGTKSGRLMGTIRAAIAGLERTEILERSWAAKEEKRRRGALAQSHVVLPYGVGYSEEDGFFYKSEALRVRDAFNEVLKGNHNYRRLSQSLGVTPRGCHLILRNSIYTGWRVIDKRRDPSGSGRYPSKNGRQSDRRKIARRPEEVIRIKVISQPLISEADFQAVQQIMDQKQVRHWRCQPNVQHRFTYNGFLTCACCGAVVHTAWARGDYYACSGRRVKHTCKTKYMGRQKLECILDDLFARRLSDPEFIGRCVESWRTITCEQDSEEHAKCLRQDAKTLQQKRQRVIDLFVEGVITAVDRDRRLATIDQDLEISRNFADRGPGTEMSVDTVVKAFSPLHEWEFWSRDEKRAVLSSLAPQIVVADYEVKSLGLNSAVFSNESTHMDRDS